MTNIYAISRLSALYPNLNLGMAKLTLNTLSIELPPVTAETFSADYGSYCYSAAAWQFLPWLAYLGDDNYANLLRRATLNPIFVQRSSQMVVVAEPGEWRKIYRMQLENLRLTRVDAGIGRRMHEARKAALVEYLRRPAA